MYSVVLPVLNEKESLKELLPHLLSPKCEVIVVDNGSTDGSVELVETARYNYSNLRLSKGTGTVTDAILRGIKEAYYEDVVIMDSDGSHPPEIAYKLAMSLDSKDMAIGSRYARGGYSKDSLRNKFISKGLNLLTYPLAPKITDRVSGLWAIKKSKFNFSIRNTVKPVLEFLVRGKLKSVVEVPYGFEPRVSGKTKHNRSTLIFRTFWDVFLLYMAKFRVFNYMVVGGTCWIINLSIYYPLTLAYKETVTFLNHVYYLPPFVVSTFISGSIHYFMNRKWTFTDRKDSSLGFLKFWTSMGPTAILDVVVIYLLVEYLHLEPVVAVAIAILGVFLIRYTIANRWVWNHTREGSEE